MRRYRITIEGRTYEVEIEDPRARPVIARVGDDVFLVDVDSGTIGAERAPAPSGTAPARPVSPLAPQPLIVAGVAPPQALTAPIPGTVVSVAVKAGDTVQRGDELLTIEAMKMFNVIRSPRAGAIADVHVAGGQHVAQGDPLVTYARAPT